MYFDVMKWINVDDLRDKPMFFGGMVHSAMKKPGKWGHLSKCLCYLATYLLDVAYIQWRLKLYILSHL